MFTVNHKLVSWRFEIFYYTNVIVLVVFINYKVVVNDDNFDFQRDQCEWVLIIAIRD